MRLHPVFPTIPLLSSDYRDSSRSPGIPSVAARDYVFSIFTVSSTFSSRIFTPLVVTVTVTITITVTVGAVAYPFLPGKKSPDLWLLNGDGDGDLDAGIIASQYFYWRVKNTQDLTTS